MGRGSSSGTRTRRAGGGGGINPGDIKNTQDLVSMREGKQAEVDGVLEAARGVYDSYGEIVGQFVVSDIGGRSSNAMAYSDGENIGFNSKYFNSARMTQAYDACVADGFHPPRGNKGAIEAVAAHEFGHVLTERAGRNMGGNSIDSAATRIVKEARANTSHRGVVQLAAKISTYATHSNAEAVAEAYADVYCNGKKARAESHAIVNVLNKYLNASKP